MMKNHTFEIETTTEEKVMVLPDPHGLMFQYITKDERGAVDVFHVGVKASNVKRIVKSLKYGQKYTISDRSLSIWEEGRSLQMRFSNDGIDKQCAFPCEATAAFVQFLSAYIAQNSAG